LAKTRQFVSAVLTNLANVGCATVAPTVVVALGYIGIKGREGIAVAALT